MVHQFIVLFQRFAKSEARIYDNVLYAQVVQARHLFSQIQEYLFKEILVVWRLLHRLWRALHVHQYIRYSGLCHRSKHIPIQQAARNIIDDVNAKLFNAHSHHVSPKSIHAHYQIRRLALHNRQATAQTRHFFFDRHIIRARSAAISTDVEH